MLKYLSRRKNVISYVAILLLEHKIHISMSMWNIIYKSRQ